MTKEELLKILKDQADNTDYEVAHSVADDALLEFVADEEIQEAYSAVGKWYA